MSYLVLARKWRPLTFADLVGQEHVAQTLKNALAQGRIAHAFLFTGARGVGKTTIARVMAKALNCLSSPGPTAEPCGTCSACQEIARSADVDVREIDGASNNSVEDVRRLQETLPYMPVRDRFKVVIVDEVHMLSTGAFNALLKTLEEPPPHVKFVFATTEVHKVPITILSRCQRYDFKLIPTARIRERLSYILQQEGIKHEDGAVALVAREAAGSMRDALSLLDQVIAAAPDLLTTASVSQTLGVADHAVLYDLARAVLEGDAPKALRTIQTVAHEGYDLPQFARAFLGVLRDLVVARVVKEPAELLDLADDERNEVLSLASAHDTLDLERLFAAWSRTTDETARAREPRWVLEMSLVRLAHRPALVPMEDLIARLGEIERRGGGSGGGDNRPPTGGGGGGGAGPRAPTATASSAASTTTAPASSPTASPAPQPAPRASVTVPSPSPTVSSAPSFRPPSSAPSQPTAPRASVAPSQPAMRASVNTATAAVIAPTPTLDLARCASMLDAWESVLAVAQNAPIPVLRHVVPVEVTAAKVVLALEPGGFYAKKASSQDVQNQIALAAEQVFGQRPAVEIVQVAMPDDAPTLARRDESRRSQARAAREEEAKSHPMVKRFLEVIGGEVRAVRLDESGR